MTHSPARIVAALLVELSLAIERDGVKPWPVSTSNEFDSPDNAIVVRDAVGQSDGRAMPTGQRLNLDGFQVRIRGESFAVAYAKANAIQLAFAEDVENVVVHVDSSRYLVHCLSKIGDVLDVGKDKPASSRHAFTLNALLTATEL